jgi:hypothetical protein
MSLPILSTAARALPQRLPTMFVVSRSWLPLLLILLRAIRGPTATLAYLALPLYSLFGRRQALVALTLVWLFNILSHGFGIPPGGAAAYRHFTILAAGFSVLLLHAGRPPRSRCPTFVLMTGGLCGLLVVHSLLLSTAPDISALKAISFSITLMALLVGWSRLDDLNAEIAQRQIWGLLILIGLASIPLVGMGMGYMRNGRGFQGVLVHPQNFGPTMAFVATWLFARWLTGPINVVLAWGILPLSLLWVYLSQARIGMLSFVVGVFAAVAFEPLILLMNQWRGFATTRKLRVAVLFTAGVLALAIAGQSITAKVEGFLGKGSEVGSLQEAFEKSRGFLVDRMKVNIAKRPLSGIGLGVPSIEGVNESLVVRDPFFGIVLMAPVEKGVLPVAMVEEFGWPLAILWFAWFAGLQLMACRAGVVNAAVCAAALASNVGEAAFFAPGGYGLLPLVLATMCAMAPAASSAGKARLMPRFSPTFDPRTGTTASHRLTSPASHVT